MEIVLELHFGELPHFPLLPHPPSHLKSESGDGDHTSEDHHGYLGINHTRSSSRSVLSSLYARLATCGTSRRSDALAQARLLCLEARHCGTRLGDKSS